MARLGESKEFAAVLGLFHMNFSALDATVDFAIGKFLKLSADETHFITASMEFGRKVALLKSAVSNSSDPKRDAVLGALKPIQADTKRNVFVHSYLSSDETTVTFVERIPHGKFNVKLHRFTWPEFQEHVNRVARDSIRLQSAVGITQEGIDAFSSALERFVNSDKTSPTPPHSKE